LYTYVTQTGAVGCAVSDGCNGDARRVIVAAVLHNPSSPTRRNIGPNAPTYSTTVLTNPVASDQPNRANGLWVLGLLQ
jgi:hypothetical protein